MRRLAAESVKRIWESGAGGDLGVGCGVRWLGLVVFDRYKRAANGEWVSLQGGRCVTVLTWC